MVGGKVRMENNIQEPSLALTSIHFRKPGDRRRRQHPVSNDSQAPGPLCDQHLTGRQPGDGPGVVQPLHNGHNAEIMARRPVYLRLRLGVGKNREPEDQAAEQRPRREEIPSHQADLRE